MPIGFNMSLDARQLKKMMRNFPKQIAFASAKALTKTAQHAQNAVIRDIPGEFDTTKTWWKKNQPTGIRVKAATRYRQVATVYTGPNNTWAARHEFGEARQPRKGKALIIPIYNKSGSSLGKGDTKWRGIKPATWKKARGRRALHEKYSSNTMSALTKSGNRKKYPFVFETSGGVTMIIRKKSGKPEPLFVEKRSSKKAVKKWGFRKRVTQIAKQFASVHFEIEMREAVRTAR